MKSDWDMRKEKGEEAGVSGGAYGDQDFFMKAKNDIKIKCKIFIILFTYI